MKNNVYFKMTTNEMPRPIILNAITGSAMQIETGITDKDINDFLDKHGKFMLATVEEDNVKDAVMRLRRGLPKASDIMISIKYKDLSFTISELSPIINLISKFSNDARTIWGISADRYINKRISITLLTAN